MPEKTNYAEEPKESVIKGKSKLEKKSARKKIIDFLFTDKIDSVGNYLAYSILGPSLKDLIFKIITGATQMALYGGNSVVQNQSGTYIPGVGYRPTQNQNVPYNSMANPNFAQTQVYSQQRISIGDVSFDTKDDAWLVLDRMSRDISRYGQVRMADFYTYAGITGQESNWALQGNGWYNISNAHPMMRTDGRWIIDLPPVQSLR